MRQADQSLADGARPKPLDVFVRSVRLVETMARIQRPPEGRGDVKSSARRRRPDRVAQAARNRGVASGIAERDWSIMAQHTIDNP
jgi:hypothetical protein